MHRKDTWEVYMEHSGGIVRALGKGMTRAEAERLAKDAIDYDANEMGSTVTELRRSDTETYWMTGGTVCGAYREWEEETP